MKRGGGIHLWRLDGLPKLESLVRDAALVTNPR